MFTIVDLALAEGRLAQKGNPGKISCAQASSEVDVGGDWR